MKVRFLLFAILYAWFARDGARGQQRQPVTSIQPDCMVFFNLSVASSGAQATPFLPGQSSPPAGSVGTSIVIDNHQAGCYGWTVAYTSHGFSAVSLVLQSAPDNAGGTAPGTWATVTAWGRSISAGGFFFAYIEQQYIAAAAGDARNPLVSALASALGNR